MDDQARPLPLSGEIMAGPGASCRGAIRSRSGPPRGGVVEADFTTFLPAAAAGPDRPAATRRVPAAEALAVLSRPLEPAPRGAPGGALFWTTGLALAVLAFWVSGGHALVLSRVAEATAARAGVRVAEVTSRIDASGKRPMLLVDGAAVNEGKAPATLAALEITVTGNDGAATRYRLGAGGAALGGGERFAFSSRLDVPEAGVKAVSVAVARPIQE